MKIELPRGAVLRPLLDVALMAAELVAKARSEGFEVHFKGPFDPVTTADRAANELICRELGQRFPGVPIVAEESDPQSYDRFHEAEWAFFVDPIDGTREFIGGSDEFVVMIGLTRAGSATAGVVYAPLVGVGWCGEVGADALRVEGNTERRITVSDVADLSAATLLGSHDDPRRLLEQLPARVGKVQPVGSAGLKGALIAEGSAELYVSTARTGKRWDACAIDALLKAAGGTLTDTYGRAIDYRSATLDNEDGLLATNGRLLKAALGQLAWHREQRGIR